MEETKQITMPREVALTIYNEGIRKKELADLVLAALTEGTAILPGEVTITLLKRDALKWEEVLKDNSLQVPMGTGHRLSEAFVDGAFIPPPEDRRWKLITE